MKKCRHIAIAVLLSWTTQALASEFTLGLGAVDESDDRPRGSLVAHATWGENFFTRLVHYGRTSSVVQENTFILASGWRFPIFHSKSAFKAGIGFSVLREDIHLDDVVSGEAEDVPATSVSEQNYNFGALFGIYWEPQIGPVVLSFGWDSNLYLAGQAGVFLATGRKQVVSVGAGVRI